MHKYKRDDVEGDFEADYTWVIAAQIQTTSDQTQRAPFSNKHMSRCLLNHS